MVPTARIGLLDPRTRGRGARANSLTSVSLDRLLEARKCIRCAFGDDGVDEWMVNEIMCGDGSETLNKSCRSQRRIEFGGASKESMSATAGWWGSVAEERVVVTRACMELSLLSSVPPSPAATLHFAPVLLLVLPPQALNSIANEAP